CFTNSAGLPATSTRNERCDTDLSVSAMPWSTAWSTLTIFRASSSRAASAADDGSELDPLPSPAGNGRRSKRAAAGARGRSGSVAVGVVVRLFSDRPVRVLIAGAHPVRVVPIAVRVLVGLLAEAARRVVPVAVGVRVGLVAHAAVRVVPVAVGV